MSARYLTKRLGYIYTSLSRYPLAVCIILLCAVIVVSVDALAMVTLVSIFCVLAIIFHKQITTLFLCALVIAIGLYRIDQKNDIDHAHLKNFVGENLTVEAKIISYPYEKNNNKLFLLEPKFIISEDRKIEISNGKLKAKSWKYFELKKGDTIRFESFLEEPENFDEFDYKSYLENQNIYALVEVPFNHEIISREDNFFLYRLSSLRENIITYFRRNLPEPHASLMLGMLIGTREEFSTEFEQGLSYTGTAHIIAVSGFNVNIIILLLINLAGHIPRKYAYYLSFIVILSFIAIVGFDNLPAVRAMIMGYSVIIAQMIGRKSVVWSSLSIAFLVMFFQNPYVILSLSFQLSFAATLGLILLSKQIESALPIEGPVAEELSVTLAANFTTFPIIFSSFGKINVWSPVANVLVGPVVPIIMLLGVIQYICSFFFSGVSSVINYFSWFVIEYMVEVINWVATFPYVEILINDNLFVINAIYLLVISLIIFELNYKDTYENSS